MSEQTVPLPASVGLTETHNCIQNVPSSLPEHLIGLSNKEWAVWRTVALRGSGFPIGQVLELAAPMCAAAADRCLLLEEKSEQSRTSALTFLRAQIDLAESGCDLHRRLVKTLRVVRDASFPEPLKAYPFQSQELEHFHFAYQELLVAYQALQEEFATANLRTSQILRKVASTERFREAVLWQNRRVLHNNLDALVRTLPGQGGARQRKDEILLANYFQRYCTKNDSIGFFGPVGWATLTDRGEVLTAQPGPGLLAKREVFLEFWGIEALAETLAQDPALRPWLVPRLMPHVSLAETTLILPFARPVQLTKNQLALLRSIDGIRTAAEIAQLLVDAPEYAFSSNAEVYVQLEQLAEQRRIMWGLAITPEGSYPERSLRRLLARIGDEQLRAEKLDILARVEQARDAISRASGSVAKLDQALGELETVFTAITASDPVRNAGQVYGSRTLVYEDCRRDIAVTLGPDILRTLEGPLTLMLSSARWLTCELGRWHEELFETVYQEIAEHSGTDCIDFACFWLWMLGQIFDDDEHFAEPLLEELQARWSYVLGDWPADARRVSYTSEQLRPLVEEAFAAPRPGWNAARYHSPDLLLRASGPEAVRRGEYQIILGELHISMNTLQLPLFLAQHPDFEQLIRQAALDLPEPRLLPVLSKHIIPSSGRMRPYLISSKDARLLYTADTGIPDHARIFSTGDLVIEKKAGQLLVRTRDHSWQCHLLEAFGELLGRHVYNSFKPLPERQHMPRITIDEKVVIAREAWKFSVAEIPGTFEKEATRRFLEVRRWAVLHGIPRFTFFHVQHENKPCFLDLESPVSVAAFARMVHQSQEIAGASAAISLSEMLPEPDQLWLPDADGQRYTSELRIVALDLTKAFV